MKSYTCTYERQYNKLMPIIRDAIKIVEQQPKLYTIKCTSFL